MKSDSGEPKKTKVEFPMVRPLGALVQVEMKVEHGTKIAIDNIQLLDCSPDFEKQKAPEPTKPPGLRAPMLSDKRYGTYWQVNQANIAKYNRKNQTNTQINTKSSTKSPISSRASTVKSYTAPIVWTVPPSEGKKIAIQTEKSTTIYKKSTTSLPTTITTSTSVQSSRIPVQASKVKTTVKPLFTAPVWDLSETTELSLNEFVRSNDNEQFQSTTRSSIDLDKYARPNVTKKQKSDKSKSSNTSSALARLPYSSILIFIIAVLT